MDVDTRKYVFLFNAANSYGQRLVFAQKIFLSGLILDVIK